MLELRVLPAPNLKLSGIVMTGKIVFSLWDDWADGQISASWAGEVFERRGTRVRTGLDDQRSREPDLLMNHRGWVKPAVLWPKRLAATSMTHGWLL